MVKCLSCAIKLSTSCKNNCVFCKTTLQVDGAELERQERDVAKALEEYIKQGFEKIEISGHDPIEYEWIAQLIGYMKKRGFRDIMLSTHGRRLCDKRFCGELALAGLTSLRIPIYGSTAAVHDSVTKAEGSFRETIEGLRLLIDLAPQMKILLHSLILKQNKDDINSIISLAKGLGIDTVAFSIPCVAVKDYSFYIPIKEMPRYIKKLADCGKKVGVMIILTDIPFCVFEVDIPKSGIKMRNDNPTVEYGTYFQPPEMHKSGIKNLAAYNLKKKIAMCKECKYDSACAGFYLNDIELYGTGSLKPIREKE
jgi:uncharacterized Fe-S cluster-containing radical SAM superfamily protein